MVRARAGAAMHHREDRFGRVPWRARATRSTLSAQVIHSRLRGATSGAGRIDEGSRAGVLKSDGVVLIQAQCER
jgi:hypothetical protein